MTGRATYDAILGKLRQSDIQGQARAVINVTDYGVTGDGSDESTYLQAAFDAAASLRGSGRPLVYIHPGLSISCGSTPLWLDSGIDLIMRGSSLLSAVTDAPALKAGRFGYTNYNGYFDGIQIYCNSGDSRLRNDTIGFQLINGVYAEVHLGELLGFRRGFQLRAQGALGLEYQYGYFCGYCRIYVNRITAKYAISLHNGDDTGTQNGWVNDNVFYGGDLFNAPLGCGQVAGVIFEKGTSQDNTQQDNKFYNTTFQIGTGDNPSGFVSGGNVPASMVGAYYVDGGFSYLCTASGTFGTTALHLISTTPGETFTSGTAHFTVEGQYVRCPVIFDGCGMASKFIDSYWEACRGPFFFWRGTQPWSSSGHRASLAYIGGGLISANPMVGDRTGDRGAWAYNGSTQANYRVCGNLVTLTDQTIPSGQAQARPQLLRSTNWHRRFIQGTDGWSFPGLVGRYNDTLLGPSPYYPYELGDKCIVNTDSGFYQIGPLIPTDKYKRFRVRWEHTSDSHFGGWLMLALDANLQPISEISEMTSTPKVWCDLSGSTIFGSSTIVTTTRNNWEVWICCADEVKYLHFSHTWGQAGDSWDGIEIECFIDDWQTEASPIKFVEPYGSSTDQRISYGTPLAGYFLSRGEFIANGNASGAPDTINGWNVVTAGILAKPWVASTAVLAKSLRSKDGKVYAARENGTTGSSGPSGTGTGITDGGVTWDYKGTLAVLNEVLQYVPHDPRSDLNYFPYHIGTFVLGTDDDSDGLSNGISRDTYGTQTGITYVESIVSGRQSHRINRASGADYGFGCRLNWAGTITSGKDYFVLVKGQGFKDTNLGANLGISVHDGASTYADLTSSCYVPDGYPTTPLGGAKPDGTVILACRFTAAYSSSDGIATFIDVDHYGGIPQDAKGEISELWIIDIAAAETGLGISLAGLSSAELYAIINTALTSVPPNSIKLKDTVTGGTVYLSINNGVLTVS